jgi:AcrR family transcriptional regulator
MSTTAKPARRRVPAAERRQELIAAAVHEFAHGGLHGTPVERIARRVGVAQPYVFSLFPSKRDLFLAALERSFERVAETFRKGAQEFAAGTAPADCEDALQAMGRAYKELLVSDRDYLMLQHQSYAACATACAAATPSWSISPSSSPAPIPNESTISSATGWPSTSPPR